MESCWSIADTAFADRGPRASSRQGLCLLAGRDFGKRGGRLLDLGKHPHLSTIRSVANRALEAVLDERVLLNGLGQIAGIGIALSDVVRTQDGVIGAGIPDIGSKSRALSTRSALPRGHSLRQSVCR